MCAAHALPMFREARQRSTRKQLEKDRLDPMKSHKPEPPVSGPGENPDSSFFFFLLKSASFRPFIPSSDRINQIIMSMDVLNLTVLSIAPFKSFIFKSSNNLVQL